MTTPRRLATLALALAGCASGVAAPSVTVSRDRGAFVVRVSSATGSPLSGFQATLSMSPDQSEGTSSDATAPGLFARSDAAPGLYTVLFTKPGYLPAQVTLSVVPGQIVERGLTLELDAPSAPPGHVLEEDAAVVAPRVYAVDEAARLPAGSRAAVEGLLLHYADTGRTVLCELAKASIPPQCGGASVAVAGVDIAAVRGIRYHEVQRVWYLEGAVLNGRIR